MMAGTEDGQPDEENQGRVRGGPLSVIESITAASGAVS